MTNLDDIERRIKGGIYGDDWLNDTTQYDACSALAEIIAEVARLRGEVTDLQNAYTDGLLDGSRAERATVVAWLRAQAKAWMETYTTSRAFERARCLDHTANAIESGEHRREENE